MSQKRFYVAQQYNGWRVIDRHYPDTFVTFQYRAQARKRAGEQNAIVTAAAPLPSLHPQQKEFLRCVCALLRAPRNRFGRLQPDHVPAQFTVPVWHAIFGPARRVEAADRRLGRAGEMDQAAIDRYVDQFNRDARSEELGCDAAEYGDPGHWWWPSNC